MLSNLTSKARHSSRIVMLQDPKDSPKANAAAKKGVGWSRAKKKRCFSPPRQPPKNLSFVFLAVSPLPPRSPPPNSKPRILYCFLHIRATGVRGRGEGRKLLCDTNRVGGGRGKEGLVSREGGIIRGLRAEDISGSSKTTYSINYT